MKPTLVECNKVNKMLTFVQLVIKRENGRIVQELCRVSFSLTFSKILNSIRDLLFHDKEQGLMSNNLAEEVFQAVPWLVLMILRHCVVGGPR